LLRKNNKDLNNSKKKGKGKNWKKRSDKLIYYLPITAIASTII
jgi:hypothetical protein